MDTLASWFLVRELRNRNIEFSIEVMNDVCLTLTGNAYSVRIEQRDGTGTVMMSMTLRGEPVGRLFLQVITQQQVDELIDIVSDYIMSDEPD